MIKRLYKIMNKKDSEKDISLYDVTYLNNEDLTTILIETISNNIHYISHPSLTPHLECVLNLTQLSSSDHILFNKISDEIQELLNISFTRNHELFSIFLKGDDAKKLLTLIFKKNTDHPLYSLWQSWPLKTRKINSRLPFSLYKKRK